MQKSLLISNKCKEIVFSHRKDEDQMLRQIYCLPPPKADHSLFQIIKEIRTEKHTQKIHKPE